jgi:hypothetical protein
VPIRLNNNRVCRPAKVEHGKAAFGAPPSDGDSPNESGVGVLRGDMPLPDAIDGAERSLRQPGRQRVHSLHASSDPFGLVKHLIDLAVHEQVDRASHVEVSIA